MIKKQELIDFEKEVIKEYKKGETYGPVHLSGGNEEQLIEIFKKIKPWDWVFSTHRSHYHALLKSDDRDWLLDEIIKKANSSHINSKEYKIFTSSIVGGIIPIALGTALGIKLNKSCVVDLGAKLTKEQRKKGAIGKSLGLPHVWCFVGDMASEMGCFEEAIKYARGYDLPITFIIEDNGLGCNTPTYEVWKDATEWGNDKVIRYCYTRIYPHYGVGEFITLKDKKYKTKGDYQAEKIK